MFNDDHKDGIRALTQEIMHANRISPLEAHMFTIRSDQSLEILRKDYESCSIEILHAYASATVFLCHDLPLLALEVNFLVYFEIEKTLANVLIMAVVFTTFVMGIRFQR